MKRLVKRGFTISLILCMMVNLCTITASAMEHESSVELTQYNAWNVKMLHDLKSYTDEDILILLEYDSMHLVSGPGAGISDLDTSLAPVTFPQNPKDGDVVYDRFKISKSILLVGAVVH
ncbi:hypothetical protein OBV_20470 [Oscillibacter valericigenes Sjm18-20]|nr:hypothetical protein OBV_20470 [Oscillibacter valericigenes Sjm18-20]